MTGEQIWDEIAGSIRAQIGRLGFNTWFRDLTVVAFGLDMSLLPPKPVPVVSDEPCVRVLTRAAG